VWAGREAHHQDVATWSQPEDLSFDDGLPEYLADLPDPAVRDLPTLREVWTGAHHLATSIADSARGAETPPLWSPAAGTLAGRGEPATWLNQELPARFFRLVRFPASSLAVRLAEWWSAGAVHDVVTVAERLRLGPPHGASGEGWTMEGALRRLTRWHWVPVVVELWPHHGNWMMTMTPQARIVASDGYFRIGHLVLDRLTIELAGPAEAGAVGSAQMGPPACGSPRMSLPIRS
jgi:hypothetical protein